MEEGSVLRVEETYSMKPPILEIIVYFNFCVCVHNYPEASTNAGFL